MSAPVVTQRKRRSRGGLGQSAHELRYAEPTLNGDGCFLDGSRARDDGDVRDALNRSTRAAKAVAVSRPASAPRVSLELPPRPNFNELGDGEAARRREAIAYFYRMIGAPDEETWDGPDGWAVWVRKQMNMSPESTRCVKEVFRQLRDADSQGVLYDPRACDLLAGAAPLIVEDSMEATIVCNAVQQGVSLGQATVLVNVARGKAVPERAPLSYSAVQGYCARSDVVDVAKRGTKKSGSLDVNSPWAIARLAQCVQFKAQFDLGLRREQRNRTRGATRDAGLPPLYADGIAFWDESHFKVRLGKGGKYEFFVCRHPETGNPCSEDEGGVWPEACPTTNVKYAGEARFLFGVAAVTQNGSDAITGVKGEPLDYSKLKVVGVKKWNKAFDAELVRARGLVGGIWAAVKNGKGEPKGGGGYEALHPETWRDEVAKKLRSGDDGILCVTVLMDHVVQQSEAMFKGTTHEGDFFIYHDALSAWWEKEAQEHIASLGYADRQVRCIGDTNADFGRYKGCLVGDSPELMPLDAHLFSDLSQAIWHNVAVTSALPPDDERRFSTGTPREMASTVKRVWDIAPTSARIVEDCTAIPMRIEKIIEAKGIAVQDIAFRTGRRYIGVSGADVTNKPRKRQRKATNSAAPLHPDAQESWDILGGRGAG